MASRVRRTTWWIVGGLLATASWSPAARSQDPPSPFEPVTRVEGAIEQPIPLPQAPPSTPDVGMAASGPEPGPTSPQAPQDDPEQVAQAFQERVRNELTETIGRYDREAQALRERLQRVEAALGRLRVIQAAFDQGANPPPAVPMPNDPADLPGVEPGPPPAAALAPPSRSLPGPSPAQVAQSETPTARTRGRLVWPSPAAEALRASREGPPTGAPNDPRSPFELDPPAAPAPAGRQHWARPGEGRGPARTEELPPLPRSDRSPFELDPPGEPARPATPSAGGDDPLRAVEAQIRRWTAERDRLLRERRPANDPFSAPAGPR